MTLTVEQRVMVAKAVLPEKRWSISFGGESIQELTPKGFVQRYWNPDVNDAQWRALVEWLADRVSQMPLHFGAEKRAARIRLFEAIRFKNIPDMETMVIEFIEPKTPKPEPEPDFSYCHSGRDGDCFWKHCPQLRDDEPKKSGRHCPLDHGDDDE